MNKPIRSACCLGALWFFPNAAQATESYWQGVYCSGMQLEYELPSGGRVDCLNPNFAIEVEWADKWAESVGQSLYYAAATDRKPGIILLCTQSEGPIEGLCRSYVYRLEYALKFVPTHVQVWTCAVDKDRTLNDCFEPTIQEPAVREDVHIEQPPPVKENPLLKPLSGSPGSRYR